MSLFELVGLGSWLPWTKKGMLHRKEEGGLEPQRLNEKYTRILEFLVESKGKRKAPRRDKAAEVEQLLLFLQQYEDPPKFFRAAEIGRALGIDAGEGRPATARGHTGEAGPGQGLPVARDL